MYNTYYTYMYIVQYVLPNSILRKCNIQIAVIIVINVPKHCAKCANIFSHAVKMKILQLHLPIYRRDVYYI